jgi:hypothetical protein
LDRSAERRAHAARRGGAVARTDRFAYAALAYVGDSDAEGRRVGSKALVVPQHQPEAGAADVAAPAGAAAARNRGAELPDTTAARRRRGTAADSPIGIDAKQAIAGGILCAGNPDTVYRQIMDIYDKVGGFGHFIFVGRPGFLDHQEAEKGIRLMAKEVVPRLPAAPRRRRCRERPRSSRRAHRLRASS